MQNTTKIIRVDMRDPRSYMNPQTGAPRRSQSRGTNPYSPNQFLILNWTYTFSAKERDSETSLSYFGSRYYSSDLSIWLSVDPMSGKYPSLSPYVYCANNPVKLVDPNGNFPIIPFLIKAGINAMADCLMQAAMNYYFNPQTAGDLRVMTILPKKL
jgi:RHS repeat-associated protein